MVFSYPNYSKIFLDMIIINNKEKKRILLQELSE